ncbi:Bro-N domain-containing protein [Escherichia coli O2:H6]
MKSIIKHFECELSKGNIVELDAAFYQGKPVFLAVPLARALGYANPADALKKHCKSLIKLNYSKSRELGLGDNPCGIQLVGQADVFRLIMRSSLPSAERLQDWICEEVLPALMETGTYSLKQKKSTPSNGLPEYRKAKALKMEMEVISSVLDRLPHLGDKAKQAAYASVINRSAGFEVIPLPVLDEHHYSATEVGKHLGVTANKVGRIANTYMLKTEQYGKWFIDKSPHSDKQVETFRYNNRGVQKIEEILEAENNAEFGT